jgi:hypothetical protein
VGLTGLCGVRSTGFAENDDLVCHLKPPVEKKFLAAKAQRHKEKSAALKKLLRAGACPRMI